MEIFKFQITYINTFYDEHKNLGYTFSHTHKKLQTLYSFFLENIYLF